MRSRRAVLARVGGHFTGCSADDDLRAGVQAHLEMEIEEKLPPAGFGALRAARVDPAMTIRS
jgi:hypothetical protein